MPAFLLTVLRFLFLGLLYLFVFWVIRWVVIDLRARAGQAEPAVTPPPRPRATGAGRPPRAIAVLDERGARIHTVRLDGGAVQVGRAEACQLRIDDTFASAFHARLFHRDGSWFLEDLGSTNGTYLNQRRVTEPVAVSAGDRVRIGKTLLELRR